MLETFEYHTKVWDQFVVVLRTWTATELTTNIIKHIITDKDIDLKSARRNWSAPSGVEFEFNRPSVSGTVLKTALSICPFSNYLVIKS